MPVPINERWLKRQRAIQRKKLIRQAVEKIVSIFSPHKLRLGTFFLIAFFIFAIVAIVVYQSKVILVVLPAPPVHVDTTATVVAANPYPAYFHHGHGTIAINDSLHQPSGSIWQTSGNCRFVRQTYHVSAPSRNHLDTCYGRTTKFRNFAYEVEMTILKGDCGGLLFRKNSSIYNKYYLFYVCQDRIYDLLKYVDSTNANARSLPTPSKTNSAIIAGPGKTNKIAVVAQGNTIYLYINNRQIAEVYDNSYKDGYLALVAYSKWNNDPTEVAYRNFKVWTL